mgnify:CR=1 FL=1
MQERSDSPPLGKDFFQGMCEFEERGAKIKFSHASA